MVYIRITIAEGVSYAGIHSNGKSLVLISESLRSGDVVVMDSLLTRIFHEKEVANPFQAIRIRLSDHSKKGIRRDRLYTRPT